MELETPAFKDLQKLFEDVAIRFQETDKKMQETDRLMKETDRQIKKLSKELGHLGNRFGEFNEALVLPSLNKLFEKQFNCKHLSQRHRVLMNGNSIEIDLLAISFDSCYIIEIKSKYRKDDLKQLLDHIEKYKENAPEHSDKQFYGVIVATDYNKDNIKELDKKGIYFISIADDLVKLHHSHNFIPKAW